MRKYSSEKLHNQPKSTVGQYERAMATIWVPYFSIFILSFSDYRMGSHADSFRALSIIHVDMSRSRRSRQNPGEAYTRNAFLGQVFLL